MFVFHNHISYILSSDPRGEGVLLYVCVMRERQVTHGRCNHNYLIRDTINSPLSPVCYFNNLHIANAYILNSTTGEQTAGTNKT